MHLKNMSLIHTCIYFLRIVCRFHIIVNWLELVFSSILLSVLLCIWLFMAMHDHVWICMAMCGYVCLRMAM